MVVLCKGSVDEGIALGTSVDHSSSLNEFWAYSESYGDNGTTLMQLVFTKYKRANKDIIFRGFLSAT